MNNGSNERLDRVERIVEVLTNTQMDIQNDIRILLSAQVLMTDEVRKGAAETDRRFRETTEKLNALIQIVDDIIRRRPQA